MFCTVPLATHTRNLPPCAVLSRHLNLQSAKGYAAKEPKLFSIIKMEKRFVQDEYEASILVTEALETGNSQNRTDPAATGDSNPSTQDKTDHGGSRTTGVLCKQFVGSLVKEGQRQDAAIAKVNTRLKLAYQVDNPIQLALDIIKPLVQYKSVAGRKQTIPKVLSEHRRLGEAVRWILESAHGRKYSHKRDLEQSLFDEVEAIFDGSSHLYARRFNMHKTS